jgi:putative transposase
MNLPPTPNPYKRQRFPAEIIRHWGWRYWRVGLRDQEVEALRAERGISLTDEAGRSWGRQFGQAYANLWRRRRSRAGDKWPLDAVCLTINKARHDLWRAVDQGGNSRDILVQGRRAQAAAKKFFHKLLQGLTSVPRGISTAQLQSDSAATREVWPSVEHRQHRYLTNRAETSPPTDPPARAADAAGSLPRAGPALSRRLRAAGPALPPAASPALCPSLAPQDEPTIPELAGSHQVGSCSIRIDQGAAVDLQAWSWHGSTCI